MKRRFRNPNPLWALTVNTRKVTPAMVVGSKRRADRIAGLTRCERMRRPMPTCKGSRENSAEAQQRPGSTTARQRHEAHRQGVATDRPAVAGLLDYLQILCTELNADGNHHPAAGFELVHQRLWHVVRRRSHDDGIEGR